MFDTAYKMNGEGGRILSLFMFVSLGEKDAIYRQNMSIEALRISAKIMKNKLTLLKERT